MSLPGVEVVRDPTVTLQARAMGASGAVVELSGVLGQRDPGPLLAPFFEQVHRAMLEGHRTALTVDLRELRFMNSSSFKHLVTWIRKVDALPPEQRYAFHFQLSAKHHWQEVSIHALQCFSTEVITVEKAAGAS